MISHFRKLIAISLVLILTFTLTGCDSQIYREAVNLYNAQEYTQAAELFAQLGDYENSKEMISRCNYWEAVKLMEQGDFSAALPRFVKLGNYEDSPQRLLECRYQVAVAAFESGDYAQAEAEFLEFSNYRQTPEYLRQLNWQKFYDYVRETGGESGGAFVISIPQDTCTVDILVDSANPGSITLYASWEKEMGYTFRDDLAISLTRESFDAAYTANSSFTMDFNGTDIGSLQTATGRFSITDCTADMELTPETFTMTVTDNQGKVTNSNNPADGTMFPQMQTNYTVIMTTFPQVLAESGLGIIPADLGFENLA